MVTVKTRVPFGDWVKKTLARARRGRGTRRTPPRPAPRRKPDLFSDPDYMARARADYRRQHSRSMARGRPGAGSTSRGAYAPEVPGSPSATREQPHIYDTPQGRFRSDKRMTGQQLRQMAHEVSRAREKWARGETGPYRSQYVNGKRTEDTRQAPQRDRRAPGRQGRTR